MKKNSRLYRETLLRVGPDQMRGVDRLLEGKHHGIAERHTVEKLFRYITTLEDRLGMKYDNAITTSDPNLIRVNSGGMSRFLVRA